MEEKCQFQLILYVRISWIALVRGRKRQINLKKACLRWQAAAD